jgi:hypothetical protein
MFSFEDVFAMARFGRGLNGFRADILFDCVRATLFVMEIAAAP